MTDIERQLLETVGYKEEDTQPTAVTSLDEIEAQVLFTALMTDTLLED